MGNGTGTARRARVRVSSGQPLGRVALAALTTLCIMAGATSLFGELPGAGAAIVPAKSILAVAPIVNALSPSAVSAGGGSVVTISGSNFVNVTAVAFGANNSSSFTVLSSNALTAVAPVGAGSVDIRIVTDAGTSPTTSDDVLVYQPTGQLPITASGQNLQIGGFDTVFTGVNAYELATDWGTNAGCGGMYSGAQISALFNGLRPNSIVRFDVYQGTLGTNYLTHQLDWAPIDRIFYLAAQSHVYLLPVITEQSGGCDGGHWQDLSWYQGGYQDVFDNATNSDGTGDDQLSYWNYMQDVVNRYKDSPALAMWEPIGEPEASTCPAADEPSNCEGHQTCPNEAVAAAALTSFFTAVGTEIHLLDPDHLVEAGLLGGGQCGTAWTDYQLVGASPGIDVLAVHDYYGSNPMGGDQWNGMALRFSQAQALNKPIITGESGIVAGVSQSGCESLSQRSIDMQNKMMAQFAAGASMFLVWNWSLDALGPCSYNTGPGDPLMDTLDAIS
jgi:hypothetical protein